MLNPRVLLVDDDIRLRRLTADFLQRHGIRTEEADCLAAATRLTREGGHDLILLDLMLPDGDGMELCRWLRREGRDTPVIILSAKGDELDRIIGLEVGADDYLGKPCNLRELVARIFTVLRRTRPPHTPAPRDDAFPFGPFVFDRGIRSLLRQGKPVHLTTSEYQLLAALITHRQQVLNRDMLASLANGRRPVGLSRSIDIQISRLRQVIEPDPANPRYIQTVWGRGYVFVPDGAAA